MDGVGEMAVSQKRTNMGILSDIHLAQDSKKTSGYQQFVVLSSHRTKTALDTNAS